VSRGKNSKNLDMTTDQAKFVSDEAKVLLLPDGDVVLGRVSESAQIELMDAYSYISLFNSINQSYRQVVMLSKINKFIENYDEKFYPKINYTDDDYNYLFIDAAVAAAKNGFFQLKTLIDNYPILQRMDAHGYTLLHITSELDNYTLTKYLLMRGINIDVLNYNNDSALRIAEDQGNENIARLLKKAGAK
jgi:ankyrin repeat protein